MGPSKLYTVRTYDADLGDYTPQAGVPVGPYTLWGLRVALRQLRDLGYAADRDDSAVLVERVEGKRG